MTLATANELEAALKGTAAAVDQLVSCLLPEAASDRLITAMRYAVLGQGKRLRPFLVVESARLFDVSEQYALRTGAALEALHCYSLVHDDLPAMDNDDLRRGMPTVHKTFDEATAILAGDALLTFAFEILADAQTHPSPDIRVRLVKALSVAAGHVGMVGGQMRDIEAETKNFTTYNDIAAMQGMKTGALFRFACEAGAILGQADTTPLQRYADAIGLAFQIADDILDVESSALDLGKATQKDSSSGKATFVDLLGLEGAKLEARRLVETAKDALSPFGKKAKVLEETADYVIARRK